MLCPRFRPLVAAGVLALVLSCTSTEGPTEPTSPPATPSARLGSGSGLLGTGLGEGLLTCTPLPHTSVQQTVGPEGGVIYVGPHSLTVPAGALDSAVTITAE